MKINTNSQSAAVNIQEILDRLNLITQNSTGKTKEVLSALLQDVKDSAIDPAIINLENYDEFMGLAEAECSSMKAMRCCQLSNTK